MKVTLKELRELNERLQWDDIMDMISSTVGVTSSGVREAIRTFGGPVTLIVVSWSAGEALIDECVRELTGDGSDEGRGMELSDSVDLFTQGYLGDLDGIPVVASIHVSRVYGLFGFLTSASSPLKVDEGNSMWLRSGTSDAN
jgi:hypothetical protein